MIKLIIAEDHQSLIDGIISQFEYEESVSIIGTTNDGEALVSLVRKRQPDVVITDVRMPKMDGIEATKIIKKEFPSIKVIAFTMFDQSEIIKKMITAGASGYILKNSPLKDVLQAIKDVYNGKHFFDANIEAKQITHNDNKTKGRLTQRQIEILKLIALGKTSIDIANELFIGIHTVNTHRKNMIRILGLKGKNELIRYAIDKRYSY